jgi:hypothetical protein
MLTRSTSQERRRISVPLHGRVLVTVLSCALLATSGGTPGIWITNYLVYDYTKHANWSKCNSI